MGAALDALGDFFEFDAPEAPDPEAERKKRSKAALDRIMEGGPGIDPAVTAQAKKYADKVPTKATPPYADAAKEAKFQEWYRARAEANGIDPNPDAPEHQYDYRRAHEAGAEPGADRHWSSEFKLAGHPNRYVDGVDTITGRRGPHLHVEALPVAQPADKGLVEETLSGVGDTLVETAGKLMPKSIESDADATLARAELANLNAIPEESVEHGGRRAVTLQMQIQDYETARAERQANPKQTQAEELGRPSAAHAAWQPLMAVPSAAGAAIDAAQDGGFDVGGVKVNPMAPLRGAYAGLSTFGQGVGQAALTAAGYPEEAKYAQIGQEDQLRKGAEAFGQGPATTEAISLGLLLADAVPAVAGRATKAIKEWDAARTLAKAEEAAKMAAAAKAEQATAAEAAQQAKNWDWSNDYAQNHAQAWHERFQAEEAAKAARAPGTQQPRLPPGTPPEPMAPFEGTIVKKEPLQLGPGQRLLSGPGETSTGTGGVPKPPGQGGGPPGRGSPGAPRRPVDDLLDSIEAARKQQVEFDQMMRARKAAEGGSPPPEPGGRPMGPPPAPPSPGAPTPESVAAELVGEVKARGPKTPDRSGDAARAAAEAARRAVASKPSGVLVEHLAAGASGGSEEEIIMAHHRAALDQSLEEHVRAGHRAAANELVQARMESGKAPTPGVDEVWITKSAREIRAEMGDFDPSSAYEGTGGEILDREIATQEPPLPSNVTRMSDKKAGRPTSHEGTGAEIQYEDEPLIPGENDLEPPLPGNVTRLSDRKAGRPTPNAALPGEAPADIRDVPTSEINVDPERFQFKQPKGGGIAVHNAEGTTGALSDVSKWDRNKAGIIQAWRDPATGKVYVVNGHHRVALAKKLGQPKLATQMIDVATAEEARAVGALTNLAEGRGTAIDAAKFLRDSGMTAEDLAAQGVTMSEKQVGDGLALSKLDGPIFNAVSTGAFPVQRAVIIGENLPAAADQHALIKLIERQEARGRNVTNEMVRELTKDVRAAPTNVETQTDLFGSSEVQQNLAVERADLSAYIRGQLRSEKKLFGAVGKDKAATTLAGAGNVIDVEKSAAMADEAAVADHLFEKESRAKGAIGDALNEGAKRLANGENAAKVRKEVYASVREALPEALAGGKDAGVAGGEAGAPSLFGPEEGAAKSTAIATAGGAAVGGLAAGSTGTDAQGNPQFSPGRAVLGAIGGGLLAGGAMEAVGHYRRAAATELIDRAARSMGRQPTLAEFSRILQSAKGYSAEKAAEVAEHAFTAAGRGFDGAPLGKMAQDAGASATKAERWTKTINDNFGTRDPNESLGDATLRARNGGKPTSPSRGPGAPAPGHPGGSGPQHDNLAQFGKDTAPGLFANPHDRFSPFHPAELGVARTKPGQRLVRLGRDFEDGVKILYATLTERGGNVAAERINPILKAMPSVNDVRNLVPKKWWNEKGFSFLDKGAPKGMTFAETVTDPAERAAMMADPGLRDAAVLVDKMHETEWAARGLDPAKRPHGAGFMHRFIDRDATVADLKAQADQLLKTMPAGQQRQQAIDALRFRATELGKTKSQFLTDGEMKIASKPFWGWNKNRTGAAIKYLRDPEEYFAAWAHTTARNLSLQRYLPEIKSIVDNDLKLGALVEKSAPEMRDALRRLRGQQTERFAVENTYRGLVDNWTKNLLGVESRSNITTAWVDSQLDDAFYGGLSNPNREHWQKASQFMQQMGANLAINWNPVYAAGNPMQKFHIGPAYLGERYFGVGYKAAVKSTAASVGAGAADPIVKGLKDYYMLDDIAIRTMFEHETLLGKVGSAANRAMEFPLATRSEGGNTFTLAAGRAYQFRDVANEMAPFIAAAKRQGNVGIAERAAAEALASGKIGEHLFVQDRYYSKLDQLKNAAQAKLNNTVFQTALSEGVEAKRTTIFHLGRSERSDLITKAPIFQPAVMLTAFTPKEFNLFWARLTPRGKMKFLLYPTAIGGLHAAPFVGMAAATFPAVDDFINDTENGEHGKYLRFLFRFNAAQGLNLGTVPNMWSPMGKFYPGLGPDFSTARTGAGKAAITASGLLGPAGGMASRSLVPEIEAAATAERPPGAKATGQAVATAAGLHGFRGTPQLAAIHNLTDPELSPARKVLAVLGFGEPEKQAMWDRFRRVAGGERTPDAMGDEAVRRAYTFETLADIDPSLAVFHEWTHAVEKGLEITPDERVKAQLAKGLPPDAKAMMGRQVKLGGFDDASAAWHTANTRANEGDNHAWVFRDLTTPTYIEALRDAEYRATMNKDAPLAAKYHGEIALVQEKMKEAGQPIHYKDNTVPKWSQTGWNGDGWLQDQLKKQPNGLSEAERRRLLEASAAKFTDQTNKTRAYALIGGKAQLGYGRYRDNLLFDRKDRP